jgi:hypothetical protein
MFGNNPLATVPFGSDKILGQGFDPVGNIDELLIFMPGDVHDSDLSFSDSSD